MYRIVLFALLACIIVAGLPGLDDPLFGPHHYRMNESASIARNFYEGSMNILYPQINWGGAGPGYVEEGFQLYTFLVAGLYKIFGFSESLGRGLTLTFYLATAFFLFLLTRRLHGELAAVFAVFFFGASPFGLYYGRSLQPDALILLCSVLTIHSFWIWTERGGTAPYVISGIALALSVMMKPLNLYLGLPILYLAWIRFRGTLLREPALWCYGFIAVVPALGWYAHAHNLWLNYGNTNGMWGQGFPMFGTLSQRLDPAFYAVLARRILYMIVTPPGMVFLVVGLMMRTPHGRALTLFWAIGFLVAVFISAGAQFGHDYYLLPLLIISSIWMGAGAKVLWTLKMTGPLDSSTFASRAFVIILCATVVWTTYSRVRVYDRPPKIQTVERAFAQRLRQITEPGSLIVLGLYPRGNLPRERLRHRDPDGTYTTLCPVEFYQSRRRGWCLNTEDWSMGQIESLRGKNANYFATTYLRELEKRPDFKDDMKSTYTLVDENPNWVIYRLSPVPQRTAPPGHSAN